MNELFFIVNSLNIKFTGWENLILSSWLAEYDVLLTNERPVLDHIDQWETSIN